MKKIQIKNNNFLSLKNSKKASIPIVILVLGVFVVCVLAIVSFNWDNLKNKDSVLTAKKIEEVKSDIEKFYFYKSQGFSDEESANKIAAQIKQGKLIIEVKSYQNFLNLNYRIDLKEKS